MSVDTRPDTSTPASADAPKSIAKEGASVRTTAHKELVALKAACDRAAKLRANLVGFMDQLAHKGGVVHDQLGALIDRLESLSGDEQRLEELHELISTRVQDLRERTESIVDTQFQRMAALTMEYERTADELAKQAQRALESCNAIESRSEAAAEDLAQSVQEHTDRTIEGIQSREQAAIESLREHLAKQESFCTVTFAELETRLIDAREELDSLTARSAATLESRQSELMQSLDDRACGLSAKQQEQEDAFHHHCQAMDARLNSVQGQIEAGIQRIEDGVKGARATLARIEDESVQRTREAQDEALQSMRAAQSKCDDEAARIGKDIDECASTVRELLAEADQKIEEAEGRIGTFVSRSAECERKASERIELMMRDRVDLAVKQAEDRIQAVADRILGTVTSRLVEQVEAASSNANVASRSAPMDHASRQAVIETETADVVRGKDEIAAILEEARQATLHLQMMIGQGEAVQRSTQSALTEAAEVTASLRTMQQETQDSSSKLTVATERATHSREEADALVGRLAAAQAQAEGTLQRLMDTTQATQGIMSDQMQASQSLADQMAESRLAMAVELDSGDKATGKLEALHRTAMQTLEKLGAVVESAREEGEALMQAQSEARTARGLFEEHGKSLLAEVSGIESMIARAEETLSGFTAGIREVETRGDESAARIRANLDDSIRQANEKVTRFTDSLNGMIDQVTHLESASKAATRSAEHCETERGLLEETLAKVDDSVERAVAVAEECGRRDLALHETLDQATKLTQAQRHERQLDERTIADVRSLMDSARMTMDLLGRIHADSDVKADQLTKATVKAAETLGAVEQMMLRLESNQEEFAQGEAMAEEFATQARALEERFDTLSRAAETIRADLARALKEPQKVVSTAEAQAKHLSQVCQTVRKVMASLSQSALDANEKLKTYQSIGQHADQRLDTLKREIGASTSTLRQWVEEAQRAQGRLAQTLAEAPTIHQTHPLDSLDEFTREWPGELTPTVETAKPTPAETAMPPMSAMKAAVTPDDPSVVKAKARSRDIARLIEEARKRTDVSALTT